MKKFFDKHALFAPLLIILLLCIIEWCLYIWTPYSYFYSRGTQTPNVDYVATTRGDLVAEDIFTTKIPRKAKYVTDQYGARNDYMPLKSDVLIIGESFGAGAGIGHQYTPAVQLSDITGYSTVVAPQDSFDPYLDKKYPIDKALYTIKHSDPVHAKIILVIYIDNLLWHWDHDYDFFKQNKYSESKNIEHGFFSKIGFNIGEFHKNIKEYIHSSSPITILSRKFKSYLKINLKKVLHYFSLYSMGGTNQYLETQSGVIGFDALPSDLDISTIRKNSYDKLLKVANAHKKLYDFGQENNVQVIALIVPNKSLAYYNEINGTDYYSEFPGVILEDIIKSYSIPVVSMYPEFLEAISNEINNNENPVYWGDDSHWNSLGIRISMKKVGEAIKLLPNNLN